MPIPTSPQAGTPAIPLPGETPEAYLERLRALQRSLGELADAVERGQGRPAAAVLDEPPPVVPAPVVAPARTRPARPPGERRRGPDRRARGHRRRRGPDDRRRGRADERPVPVERRQGLADRRSGRPNRRLGGDRRRGRARPAAPPAVDPDLLFWALNVLCWTAVTLFALAYAG
jgi:hypothetical protein